MTPETRITIEDVAAKSTGRVVAEALAAGAGPPLGALLVWQLFDEDSRLRLALAELRERLEEWSIRRRVDILTSFAPTTREEP